MIIKNKFENKCITCKRTIKIDTEVEWEKGIGIKHIKCPVLRNYPYHKLLKLKNCQECKTKLIGDVYISDSNRLCKTCWQNTLATKLGGSDEV